MKLILCIIISTGFLLSCKDDNDASCQYKLEQLLVIDTPNTVITYKDDTLMEVRDNLKESPSGLYTFDNKKNLRFYGFFVNENEYRYSEKYDAKGNIIEKEGTPLVEYRVWKRSNDTVLFNVFLFSLNKKYEEIEIITNNLDTIRPKYLYKADIYSNMKCFPFKLRVAKKLNDLELYARGFIINTCTQEKVPFSDTTSFKETKF
jgi:hypothetical protein